MTGLRKASRKTDLKINAFGYTPEYDFNGCKTTPIDIDYTNKVLTVNAATVSLMDLYSYVKEEFNKIDTLDDEVPEVPMHMYTPTDGAMVNGWKLEGYNPGKGLQRV